MNPGDKLGPYGIKESLGAGGMGEVYLAEDTRLGRKVAIKVLPARFAADAERLARFEQEARAAAALNHPHIAAVFDVGAEVDDAGATTHFIVQEYLEGQTLRAALAKKPLPLHQALALATEIGEALSAAHQSGIVHRDLKPDNVFITTGGHAKVLDFGLAKLTEPLPGSPEISMSPTVLGTVAGQVMGTAGYMAPEQVNGEQIDARADVFAFGCILYEMVTGKRAFAGETLVDTLHAVTRTEPVSLRQIDTELPAELQRIQGKCIAKDPARRYQHVADLVVDLKALRIEVEASGVSGAAGGESVAGAMGAGSPAVATRDSAAATGAVGTFTWQRWAPPALAIWALAATALALYLSLPEPSAPVPVARFQQPLAPTANVSGAGVLAISPDGRRIAYTALGPAGNQLWVRDLDTLEARPLAGTTNGEFPQFAPDSRTLVFLSSPTEIRSIDVEAALGSDLLAQVTPDSVRGFGWGADGTLYVGSSDVNAGPDGPGLSRLDFATRKLESVTTTAADGPTADGPVESHRFPQVLPDGRILFTIETAANSTRSEKDIAVADPETGAFTTLAMRGASARYVRSGHLVYMRGETIVGVPFDLERLAATGPEVVVVAGVAGDADVGTGQFAVSDNGVLIYQTATDMMTRLALVDRRGDVELLHRDARSLQWPRISPDGRRIAVALDDAQSRDIWLFEIERGTYDPFTRLGGPSTPDFSPDGDRILFQSNHVGRWGVFVQRLEGGDGPVGIDLGELGVYGGLVWLPSGDAVGFNATPADLWTVKLDGSELMRHTETEFIEGVPDFSPDGNWMTFASNEQGRNQVYVAPFPGPGRRLLASTDGGDEPRWSRDGTELFYRRNDDMMAVAFDPTAATPLGTPERLFTLSSPPGEWTVPNYDVAPDGRFVILVGEGDAEPPRLVTVMNWFEELRRLAPVAR